MASPPSWLSSFVEAVTSSIRSSDALSPLGCHFQQVDCIWEITVFASRTEIIGGSEDGRMRNSPFSVDVKLVQEAFSSVETIAWQAQRLGHRDDLGPHLAIEGRFDDKPVWLRITSTAPERFGPGRRALVNQPGFEDIW